MKWSVLSQTSACFFLSFWFILIRLGLVCTFSTCDKQFSFLNIKWWRYQTKGLKQVCVSGCIMSTDLSKISFCSVLQKVRRYYFYHHNSNCFRFVVLYVTLWKCEVLPSTSPRKYTSSLKSVILRARSNLKLLHVKSTLRLKSMLNVI